MRLVTLCIALVALLTGCGSHHTPYDRPTTPDTTGYDVLYPATVYGDSGQIVDVDPDAAPILYLWDAPRRQANLVAAYATTYYYPVPRPQGQTTWAGSPRCNFLGTWLGVIQPGDSTTLPLYPAGHVDGLPDSVYTRVTGYAVVRWERSNGFDLARVHTHLMVYTARDSEPLDTYHVLARPTP